VALRCDFVERKPVTWCSLTSAGRKALQKHLRALQAVIDTASATLQSFGDCGWPSVRVRSRQPTCRHAAMPPWALCRN
jgi:hypothetical protein